MEREQLEEIRAEWEKQNAAHLAAKRNWRCCSACELADARVPALLDEIDRLNKQLTAARQLLVFVAKAPVPAADPAAIAPTTTTAEGSAEGGTSKGSEVTP